MKPTPKPETLSLFEREMHDQVAAAQAALAEAQRRDDPLLVQAARSHLDGLVDLARRNGLVVEGTALEGAALEAAAGEGAEALPA
jgi:hypothetical protein